MEDGFQGSGNTKCELEGFQMFAHGFVVPGTVHNQAGDEPPQDEADGDRAELR